MGPLIGYARVSTADQNPALQLDALTAAGCLKVYTDTASGAAADRPELARALEDLRPDDTLVVWRLDRLGRSLRHLVEIVAELEKRPAGFRSLTESIDTTSPGGRLVFGIFGSLAEYERALVRERTFAGLAAARARGRLGGRPRALTPRQAEMARTMYASRELNVREIAETLKVSPSSVYRYVRPGSTPQKASR